MTTQQIAIVGCGYTGLRLAREASRAGYGVVGTSRSEASLEELEAMGAEGLDWDVLDDDVSRLREVLGPQTAVVYSIPTLYRDYVAGCSVHPLSPSVGVTHGSGRFISAPPVDAPLLVARYSPASAATVAEHRPSTSIGKAAASRDLRGWPRWRK